jgi:hypothetical protein
MTSFRRKLGEDMCSVVHPLVMRRRMLLLQLKARADPRRVPTEGTSRKVKGRKT